MNYKWKTAKVTVEYSNPFFKISRHEVARPNGNKNPYFVLERSKPHDLFSIIVPLTEKNETYLIGQYRYPIDYYSWEFPMGNVVSTGFLTVAKTELKEEAGITAKSWQKIGEFFVAPGYSSQKCCVFVAKDLKYGDTKTSDSEILEVKKVPISQVFSMINKGTIKDGPTIAAAQFLDQYLN